ncbi:MAG: response regulator [Anaerolineales bacterium]|nr:response regulator [Anaerolineales bacterium]
MSAPKELYQEIFDLSPIPDAVFCQDGLCRVANSAFLVTFGYQEEELESPGIRFESLFYHTETGIQVLKTLLEKKIIRRKEVSVQTKDHIRKTMLFSGRVLDADHFETSFVDITRMKVLQREIKRDHARLSSLIEGVSAGLFLVDREGVITECNTFLGGLLGIPQENFLQQSYHEIFRYILSLSVEPAVVQQALSKALLQVQERPVIEIAIQSEDISYLDLSFFPVWDEDGVSTGWGGLLQDVSEAHDRMDWKMDLLSILAHDIRTPLAALKGHATALLGSYRSWSGDMVLEFLQAINRSTDQLIQQVDRSLALTRVEAGKLGLRPESVDLHLLLKQTLERMGNVLEGREIQTTFDESLPDVRVDPARVEEVLMNLLDNAVRYSPAGQPVRVHVSLEQDKVLVSVTDSGPGIPEDRAAVIFDQYEQLQPEHEGSGLGLYICRRIVEAHGGKIWLETPSGSTGGACFVFSLPVMPAGQVDTIPQNFPVRDQPVTADSARILVVEDEPDFQTLYYTILTEHGYQVELAPDGPTALDMLLNSDPDMVILDWLLPGMDGLNVLRGIRRWTQIPILLVTSRTSQKDLVTALDAGADDYLSKPIQSDELLARIRALLRRGDSWLDTDQKSRFTSKGFSINFETRQVWIGKKLIQLTPTEYRLIAYLALNRGQVLTYDQMVSELWENQSEKTRQDLFVHVSRLRRKLSAAAEETAHQGTSYIETRWGVGYFFPFDT